MTILYNIGIKLYHTAIHLSAILGNEKAKKFIKGRKTIFSTIAQSLENENRQTIWVHAASLGEFEQARPVIEKLKTAYPQYAIILTFFSPSGYEIRKNYEQADYVFYLPIDTALNAQRFLYFTRPAFAMFTKYDYWYHYLKTLHKQQIPTIIFSAIFQERQPFFKWYGGLHRKMLTFFNHIFVQDNHSIKLLSDIKIHDASIAGDTRLDRVIAIASSSFHDEKISHFIHGRKCIVVGSAWTQDWKIVLESYALLEEQYCIIIAPHELHQSNIDTLSKAIQNNALQYQTYTGYKHEVAASVLILDTMGMLSYIYRYGDVAWIGGGFQKSGIHNILEAATYGLPIFIGPNYSKFNEAKVLIEQGGVLSIQEAASLAAAINNSAQLTAMQVVNNKYIQDQRGAVDKIMAYIQTKKLLKDQ